MEAIKNRLERMGLWDKKVEQELKSLWEYGVERISDLQIRQSVIDFLEEEAPLSFFINPASPSKRHHPAWQNKKAGILRNTTECCLVADMQIKSYKELCDENDEVMPWARDAVLSATILSDTFKYNKEILNGKEIVSVGKVNREHGKVAAHIWYDKYSKRYDIPKSAASVIFEAIYWHLGRWTSGWTEAIKFSPITEIVHRIDAALADKSLELIFTPKRVIK